MSINAVTLDRMGVFQASYPKYMRQTLMSKIIKLSYDIFSVVFFPLGICRYIHSKIHTFLGYYLFVPSQSYSKKTKIYFYDTQGNPVKEVKQQKYLREGRQNLKTIFNARTIRLKTADGVKLNGVFVPGKDGQGRDLPEDGPLILHFLGQFGRYEDLGHYQEALSNIKNHNILVFNDRGVVKSEGLATKRNLFLDAEAVLEYARRRLNVPKEKIIVHGHSFGGIKATGLASRHRGLKLINDRSFGSLEKAVYSMAKEIFQSVLSGYLIMPFVLIGKFAPQRIVNKVESFIKEHKIYFNEKIQRPILLSKMIEGVSIVIAFVCAKIAVLFGWSFEPEKDWQKVKGKKFILFLKDDKTIPFEVSFFNSVKKTNLQFISIPESTCLHWSAIPENIFSEVLKVLEA